MAIRSRIPRMGRQTQDGSQVRNRAGPSLRSSPIKRRKTSMQVSRPFGTQERGSQTDAATRLNRAAPQRSAQPQQPQGDPINDASQLERFITPENTLRNQRIGFNVGSVSADTSELKSLAQQIRQTAAEGGFGPAGESEFVSGLQDQVMSDLEGGLDRSQLVRDMFEGQMPFLNDQFEDQAEQIASRTSALGRTGSGLVDRDFAELENQQQLKQQGLLKQLVSNAAGQAIQDRMGLLNAGQGLGGLELQRESAAGQSRLGGLNAAGGLLGQASGLGLQADRANQQRDMAENQHLRQQQAREDMLARQAMQDRLNQMRFMSRGFNSTGQAMGGLNSAAQTGLMGADQFGANAGMLTQQMGAAAEGGASQPGGLGGIVNSAIEAFAGPQSVNMPAQATPPINNTPVASRPTPTIDRFYRRARNA